MAFNTTSRFAATPPLECSAITIPPPAPTSSANKCALSLILSAASPCLATAAPSRAPSARTNKCELSFILSRSPPSLVESTTAEFTVNTCQRSWSTVCNATRGAVRCNPSKGTPTLQRHAAIASDGPTAVNTSDSVRLAKKGPRICVVDGCRSLGKHNRRCWRHGGSISCKVAFCHNRAKSKGVCWSHGGGTLCSVAKCGTIAVSKGFCWAHGGGKRCLTPHCLKPGYERTQNYCVEHYRAARADRNAPVEWIV